MSEKRTLMEILRSIKVIKMESPEGVVCGQEIGQLLIAHALILEDLKVVRQALEAWKQCLFCEDQDSPEHHRLLKVASDLNEDALTLLDTWEGRS